MGPWRRLPTYFPNISLYMLPLMEKELEAVKKTGWLRKVAFRTTPNVSKLEIKAFLESVYGMEVEKVNTLNYEGKKKRRKYGMVQRPDWKKAYVYFKLPAGSIEEDHGAG
ncbi:unnamed protein product [Ostreobium quekettii]|uniref:Large ribosomal subunit protein uL23c n=1 Tax=Ostreobium quekettii TaxID=121088 RepID=A0A8S1J017_9CHLO|nr:unnamed protein product [Ostreobium quekettii]|eukprot:evm.model.scf_431.6 EVM.evm.TU.scf_431.6   scf_431:63196-64396(-)